MKMERWWCDPAGVYKAATTIPVGCNNHRKDVIHVRMRSQAGKLAKTNEKNPDVFTPHFEQIVDSEGLPINNE
jgi:hypothetical protein